MSTGDSPQGKAGLRQGREPCRESVPPPAFTPPPGPPAATSTLPPGFRRCQTDAGPLVSPREAQVRGGIPSRWWDGVGVGSRTPATPTQACRVCAQGRGVVEGPANQRASSPTQRGLRPRRRDENTVKNKPEGSSLGPKGSGGVLGEQGCGFDTQPGTVR